VFGNPQKSSQTRVYHFRECHLSLLINLTLEYYETLETVYWNVDLPLFDITLLLYEKRFRNIYSICASRRVSLESRRQSLDSQLSVAVGDIGGRKPATPIGGVSGGRVKSRRRQRRRNGAFSTRRSSSTSQDSQLSVQVERERDRKSLWTDHLV